MELLSFGAVMKFALDREEAIAVFVKDASGNENLGTYQALLDDLHKTAKKNLKLLERTRRENVNEIVVQAISGLDVGDYELTLASGADMAKADFEAGLTCLLENTLQFYIDADRQVPNDDVCRNLKLLAKKTKRQIANIKETLNT